MANIKLKQLIREVIKELDDSSILISEKEAIAAWNMWEEYAKKIGEGTLILYPSISLVYKKHGMEPILSTGKTIIEALAKNDKSARHIIDQLCVAEILNVAGIEDFIRKAIANYNTVREYYGRGRLEEARIYGDLYRTSDEYNLTPEELSALKNMDHKQRMNFALKKIKQARRAKGQCISGGPKCEPPPKKEDGTPGPYCKKHLESFRVSRERLAQKRGSCTRCPNPPLPGKKLCKDCTDELQILRLTALNKGFCLRCKKVPAEKNEKGRQTLFCNNCNQIKKDTEKARKKSIKNWRGYGRDVVSSIRAKKIANLGIQEYAIKGSVPDEPQGDSPFPPELQKFLDVLKQEAEKHGHNVNELAALVSTDKGGDRAWTIVNLLHKHLGLRFSPKQKKWIVIKGFETDLVVTGDEIEYARRWIEGF